MTTYLPACKKNSFYIIELPRVHRGTGPIESDTYSGGAPKHLVRGPWATDDDAKKAYRKMIDEEPQLARNCAVWYSGDIGE